MFSYNWKMPAVTATGIIFFRENNELHFVIAKRSDDADIYPGEWCFIGGFLETGKEKSVNTIRREAREELNVHSNEDDWQLFHVQDTFADVDSRNEHTVNICYYLDLDRYAYGRNAVLKSLLAGDDISDFKIATYSELIKMTLAFDHSEIFYKFCNDIMFHKLRSLPHL
jgi:ADP-ribose pyrophosphatase YjhB (NUDIX family)